MEEKHLYVGTYAGYLEYARENGLRSRNVILALDGPGQIRKLRQHIHIHIDREHVPSRREMSAVMAARALNDLFPEEVEA